MVSTLNQHYKTHHRSHKPKTMTIVIDSRVVTPGLQWPQSSAQVLGPWTTESNASIRELMEIHGN